MSNFFTSSIGKKFIMSITGMFLMLFLVVHLAVNLTLLFDDTGQLFEEAVAFMDKNPLIQLMQPVLFLGLIIHVIYSAMLSAQNRQARGENAYAKNNGSSSTWMSRSMLPLGIAVFAFLAVHLIDIFGQFKTGIDENIVLPSSATPHYDLMKARFSEWWYSLIYIIGFIGLAFHLLHGFWSSFQTVGLSNPTAKTKLQKLGLAYVVIITTGYTIIPLYFLLIA